MVSGSALRSSPAQKLRPLPINTNTRTFSSVASQSSASIRAEASAGSKELARLGRLMVIRAIPAVSMATSSGSFMGPRPPYGWSQAEHAFGVAGIEFFEKSLRQIQAVPFPEKPIIRDTGIIAPEHHFVLQPSTHVANQRSRQIFRRPARHLPIHIAFVQS